MTAPLPPPLLWQEPIPEPEAEWVFESDGTPLKAVLLMPPKPTEYRTTVHVVAGAATVQVDGSTLVVSAGDTLTLSMMVRI